MAKELKLKDLKKALDKLTKEELKQPIIYNSENYYMSGQVLGIGKARATLYYTGEDDPSELYTMKQLKDNGWEKEDIESFEVCIKKGDFVIKF
jgi:ABC-type amino acid transport substrate-binding protein